MNILGFIAIILICLTALAIAYLNYRIHNIHIVKPKAPTPAQLKELENQPVQVIKPEEKPEELPITEASMDAVIQSVNELMGIQTVTKEEPHGAREE